MKVFEQWQVQGNEAASSDDMSISVPAACLNALCIVTSTLSRFVVEACYADGKEYPATCTTISNRLAGLYRHCCEYDAIANCPNFMNRKSPAFKDLDGALR